MIPVIDPHAKHFNVTVYFLQTEFTINYFISTHCKCHIKLFIWGVGVGVGI